jgi:hypothetical protein
MQYLSANPYETYPTLRRQHHAMSYQEEKE